MGKEAKDIVRLTDEERQTSPAAGGWVARSADQGTAGADAAAGR